MAYWNGCEPSIKKAVDSGPMRRFPTVSPTGPIARFILLGNKSLAVDTIHTRKTPCMIYGEIVKLIGLGKIRVRAAVRRRIADKKSGYNVQIGAEQIERIPNRLRRGSTLRVRRVRIKAGISWQYLNDLNPLVLFESVGECQGVSAGRLNL